MSVINGDGTANLLVRYILKGSNLAEQVEEELSIKAKLAQLLSDKNYKFIIADDEFISSKLTGADLAKSDAFCCNTNDCTHNTQGFECMRGSVMIQNGICALYKKKEILYAYHEIRDMPRLNSEVYVTVGNDIYHKARLLGYGLYGGDAYHNTYCVELTKLSGSAFVDFFQCIYRREEVGSDKNK